MDRLLARLERTFLGRLAVERLTLIIVSGMAVVFVLAELRPEFLPQLVLDPRLIATQPWRLATYLFIPPGNSPIWVLVSLYFFWIVGSALEQTWGAFKFNAYYLIGAVGTTIAALVTQLPQGNFWINATVYLAFATVYPDYVIYLFFVIPLRIKWLAFIAAAYIGYRFALGDVGTKAAIAVSLANYFLFFGGHLYRLARGKRTLMVQSARRSSMAPPAAETRPDRVCAICGKKQSEGADIRVCSCERCGGKPRELCLEHARNH